MGRYRNLGVFLFLAAIWGTAFMATEVGLADLPPVLFAALRFDLVAVLLFGYVIARGERFRPRTRDDWRSVLVGGLCTIGGHHAFLFAGQQYVPAAVAAVLLGLIPVITPALTRLVAAGERLPPEAALGVLVGFAGVAIIVNPDPANLLASDLRGVGLVLASAVVFAVGAVLLHDAEPSLSVLGVQPWTMLVGALSLHAASLLLPGESFAAVEWTPTALGAIAYLAVVAGATGFFCYFYLLANVGPVETSLIEYATPVTAALSAWVVLGQAVDAPTVAGFLVILLGFLLLKWRPLRAELRRLTVETGE